MRKSLSNNQIKPQRGLFLSRQYRRVILIVFKESGTLTKAKNKFLTERQCHGKKEALKCLEKMLQKQTMQKIFIVAHSESTFMCNRYNSYDYRKISVPDASLHKAD